MSSYEELKKKYKETWEELDKAIKENKPWENLLDELFSYMSEMEETPEAKEQWKRLEKEVNQRIKQFESGDFSKCHPIKRREV